MIEKEIKESIIKRLFSVMLTIVIITVIMMTNSEKVCASSDTVEVTTLAELQTALANESINTVIVKNTIALPSGTNLDGKNKTVQVEKPFISETGERNSSISGKTYIPANTSRYKVFEIPSNATVTISNMTIVGGYGAGDSDNWGTVCNSTGGVYINSGATVTMTNVSVTRSYRGIHNYGTLILKNSNIVRNSGLYGAGVQNENNALVIMDGCSFSENSAVTLDGSPNYGGGSENKGIMILNNTTMANNYASAGGAGIHNWTDGVIYIMNSTIVGNYAKSGTGGGIYANKGSITIVNSIISNNIGNNNVSEFSDVARNVSDSEGIYLYNCVYGSADSNITKTNCTQVTGDNLNNLFANYRNDGIFTGSDYTTAFKHPSLLNKSGNVSATYAAPKTGGKAQWATGSYVKTYLDYSDTSNIKMSYKVGNGAETQIGSYATGGTEVTSYYETTGRDGSVCGASKPSGDTYYTVTLKEAPVNGHVTGVTTYGDAYISGSQITVKAIPSLKSRYDFKEWQDGNGNKLSENSVYQFTLSNDIALKAIFKAHSHTWNSTTNLGNGKKKISCKCGAYIIKFD